MNLEYDWRENSDSVKDRLRYILLNDNTYQDVVIIVGCGSTEKRIKAHSNLLYTGSKVLEEMLENAKLNNEGMKEIKMPDVRPEALNFVLKVKIIFIYSLL